MSDVATTLEGIKGVGPATRTAVLDAFPTLQSIDDASLDELEAVKGVGPATAKAIKDAAAKAEAETAPKRAKAATKKASGAAKSAAKKTSDGTKAAAKKASGDAKAAAKQASGSAKSAAEEASGKTKAAATELADAAGDAVEGKVVDLREAREEVGEDADATVAQIKGAITSLQNVVLAALDAGRDAWPESERQLKAALTSIQKTGTELVDAAKKVRSRS